MRQMNIQSHAVYQNHQSGVSTNTDDEIAVAQKHFLTRVSAGKPVGGNTLNCLVGQPNSKHHCDENQKHDTLRCGFKGS
jgi:hypothetical protein